MTPRLARGARLLGATGLGALILVAAVDARTPKDPTARHRPSDMALARAIVAHQADFRKGWTPKKADSSDETCPSRADESNLVETGHADSPDFQYSDHISTVSSEAQVFATQSDALTDWRLSADLAALKKCALEDLRSENDRSTKFTLVSFERLHMPQIAPRVFAIRAKIRVSGSAGTGTFVTDVIAVGCGRAVGVVTFVTPAPPFKLSDELGLARAVSARLPRR